MPRRRPEHPIKPAQNRGARAIARWLVPDRSRVGHPRGYGPGYCLILQLTNRPKNPPRIRPNGRVSVKVGMNPLFREKCLHKGTEGVLHVPESRVHLGPKTHRRR